MANRAKEAGMAEGRRTWKTWQLLAAVAVALVIGLAAGSGTTPEDETVSAGGQAPDSTAAAAPDTTRPTTAPTTAAPTTTPGPKTEFGPGSYRVGTDIAAGTYRSSATSTNCYWKRLSNFTGQDDILANYLSASPTTVTILASDKGFETRNCGTWTKVS
jgi:hypothetical protein